ncbi:Tn7 transposase TnsA N-terminal domain-containing protein [Pseudidiomarina aestuarii]|uniref:Tn7 transposase TnsA N-terminal domain-containing protein n=1 Tax=Pseudidiomarina aestuarii TaxID=624146 RepID=UPI003A968E18
MLMEFDRRVNKLVSQPIELVYVDLNGRKQRYTPDYLVYFNTESQKPILVEVKERVEIESDFEKLRLKFKAGIRAAKANDWIFKIYDDTKIRGLLLENIRKLKNFSAHSVTQDDRAKLLTSLQSFQGPLTVKEFLEHFTADRNEYLANINRIWWLALQHDIELDLTKPLSERTLILGVNTHE